MLGEGGLITCDRDDWAERLHRMRAADNDTRSVRTAPGGATEPVVLPRTAHPTPFTAAMCAGPAATRRCRKWSRLSARPSSPASGPPSAAVARSPGG